jgi:hypothetical protein
VTTYRTADFISSIGINTHFDFGDSPVWSNLSLVTSSLSYLGIDHVRDAVPQASGGAQPLSTYASLMKSGIKFDYVVTGQNFSGSSPFSGKLAVLDQLAPASPGGITAVEGFNEPINWPVTFNGATTPQSALNAQTALYNAIKADPNLAGIPIYDLTEGHYYNSSLFQNNAGRADYQNLHVYPQSGTTPNNAPPGPAISAELSTEYNVSGPNVITEFGYYTQSDSDGMSPSESVWTPTTNALQDSLIIDGLLDAYRMGFAQTYIYNLIDGYQSTHAEDYLGVFNFDGTPKLAATGLHNLTILLKDTGATASSFPTGSVPYTLTGSIAGDSTFLMQKSDGSYWLALWNETQRQHQVTVGFGSSEASITLFDPILGTTSLQSLTNASSLPVTLGADPVLIEVKTGSTPPPMPADKLILRISEDAWRGDATFTVKMDGTQVGGTMTASALHASSDSNVFVLTGDWGPGQHNVAIQFLNDVFGGTASTDRNLYVDSVSYDGTTYANTTATMLSAGSHSFSVAGTVAAVTLPADTLVLHLSEDAWNGNAKFQLTIDGRQISTPQDIVALHSIGAWQDLTFAGNFGTGTHTVGVQFTNDAYGGTAATDRNLYVNGIDCNGQHYGSGVTTLLSNDTATFTITTAH